MEVNWIDEHLWSARRLRCVPIVDGAKLRGFLLNFRLMERHLIDDPTLCTGEFNHHRNNVCLQQVNTFEEKKEANDIFINIPLFQVWS